MAAPSSPSPCPWPKSQQTLRTLLPSSGRPLSLPGEPDDDRDRKDVDVVPTPRPPEANPTTPEAPSRPGARPRDGPHDDRDAMDRGGRHRRRRCVRRSGGDLDPRHGDDPAGDDTTND